MMRVRRRYIVVPSALLGCAALWWWGTSSSAASVAGNWSDPLVDRDLVEIQADTLRILVIEHPLVFQRLRGNETGLEYELLERFARRMHVPIKPVPVANVDSLLPLLQRGIGDVIAARLGQSNPYRKAIARTRPFRYVSPVIVTLRADRALGIPAVTDPDTVLISRGSPFIIENARRPNGQWFDTYEGKRLTVIWDTAAQGDGDLINVALGRVKAAVISDALAAYASSRLPQLAFSEPIGDPVPLFFGVRRNATRLREALDNWLADPDEKEAFTMFMSAYGARIPQRGPLGRSRSTATSGDPISPFDSLFQRNTLRHDWELLAAIAFKESRFDSTATSHMGAQGLMQMMPHTAERFGSDTLHLVEGQIQAAAKYLSALDTIWLRSVVDPEERMRFVLAAYNAGPGHVLDAQRLARTMGLDPHKWEGNTERAITLLALPQFFTRDDISSGPCQGSQTFNYVREVVGFYEQFQAITEPD